MTKRLLTRVSAGFNKDDFAGVLIAGEDLNDTYGFTELGYDTCDYEVAPIVLEVEPKGDLKYASIGDVEAAAEKAGIRLWLNFDEYMKEWPNAKAEDFIEKHFPADYGLEPNELLFKEEVRKNLEEAGFNAFHDYIAVSNTQPLVTCFWNPNTFEVSDPLELIIDDEGEPYHVRLAEPSAGHKP